MSTRVIALLLLLFPFMVGNAAQAQGGAAQAAGDPLAGKATWQGPALLCRNCHGNDGEGAFGPDLAGRGLTLAQFRRVVRQPTGGGVMPSYPATSITDAEIADVHAYLTSLKPVAEPGPWRVPLPANAPLGQQIAIATVGCLQCHGATGNGPRQDMGATGADFEWLKGLVYEHTNFMPAYLKELGIGLRTIDTSNRPFDGRQRMGVYDRRRLPEPMLREVFNFLNDLGFIPSIEGGFTTGPVTPQGVTYTLDIRNIGIVGKGLPAEDVTVLVTVPNGANVVTTTGANYQGVRFDERLKSNVAVWQVARLGPKDTQKYTLTLSATANPNVRGQVRWAKTTSKAGGGQANIDAAPMPGGTR